MIYVFGKKNCILVGSLVILFVLISVTYNSVLKSTCANIISNTIIIDPGHGGEDSGALGITGVKEKDLNLNISIKLKEELLKRGFNVIMTRDTDTMLNDKDAKKKKISDLKNRVKLANNYPNCIFLSIHMNYFDDKNQKGAQVFYSDNNKENLLIAECIQKHLKENLDKKNNREAKKSKDNIYILKKIESPACLIECGFISNPNEEQMLSKDEYQLKIVKAISDGIFEYISL